MMAPTDEPTIVWSSDLRPGPAFKDNRRQTDLCGLIDKRGHWFCFWFDNGDGGDWRRFKSASACVY